MEIFALAGKLKRAVSRQTSILELTHGPQSGFANTRLLEGLKMQMSYNHFYRTSDFAGVMSLDYPIQVKVHPGYSTPFKKTNLCQELMCMRHPPDSDGKLSPTFIDGVHYVHMGPKRGHIRVHYCNLDKNEAYVERFLMCLASNMYSYLQEDMHYMACCCQKLLTTWFKVEEGLQAEDERCNPTTYSATTLPSIANLSYNKDMEELGAVDITPELLAEMMKKTDKWPYFETKAMQRLAERMQLKQTDGANFSVIDSSTLALSENTHTKNR